MNIKPLALLTGFCTLLTELCTLVQLGACYPSIQYREMPLQDLPSWQSDHQEDILAPLKASCAQALERKNLMSRSDARRSPQWQNACSAMLRLRNDSSAQEVRKALSQWFTAYQITTTPTSSGLFTGYYEPTLEGSAIRTHFYDIPIYGLPKGYAKKVIDGQTVRVYRSPDGVRRIPPRAELNGSTLLPNTPVLAWVHDNIPRFFLDIQGSGSIELTNGHSLLLGYAGENGYPYYPIGRYLIQIGALTPQNVSLQTIQEWLYSHPDEAQDVMNMNPAFVFYRVLPTREPIGAAGVELTPGRSIAVDPDFYRYGTLFWISTSWPKVANGEVMPGAPLHRLFIAQDTGGAIEGPIRADLFWGEGDRAKWLAGHMQFPGAMWIIWPKGLPLN